MKTLYGLMMAGLVLAAPGAAMAMDSATLLGNPARYRVIGAGEDEVIYADMETVRGIQTMDFPNSLENLTFTVYVESYKDKATAMDFMRDRLVTQIREFTVRLGVDKNEKSYSMDTRLAAAYSAKGESIEAADQEETGDARTLRAKAKDLYINLCRLERLPRMSDGSPEAPAPAEAD